MKIPRLLWFLPLTHLLIDGLLAGALIKQGHDALRREKAHVPRTPFQNAALLQESAPAGFDLRYIDWEPPDAYRMIVLGSFPACLIAERAIPNWGYETARVTELGMVRAE